MEIYVNVSENNLKEMLHLTIYVAINSSMMLVITENNVTVCLGEKV